MSTPQDHYRDAEKLVRCLQHMGEQTYREQAIPTLLAALTEAVLALAGAVAEHVIHDNLIEPEDDARAWATAFGREVDQ